MKIIEKNVKNPVSDVFNATNSADTLENHIDEVITVTGYVRFIDVDTKTKEEKEYISLVSDDGFCVSTGSPVFISAFDILVDTLADNGMSFADGVKIVPTVNTSKGGNNFYNFKLAQYNFIGVLMYPFF